MLTRTVRLDAGIHSRTATRLRVEALVDGESPLKTLINQVIMSVCANRRGATNLRLAVAY
jgi:hypothetical protein